MIVNSRNNSNFRILPIVASLLSSIIFESVATENPISTSSKILNAPIMESLSAPETDNENVSYDNFSSFNQAGNYIKGDGSGDLILIILDATNKSPRKKSLVIDLSFINSDSTVNDFTVEDALSLKNTIIYKNDELTRFINKAKKKLELKWLIYGIANHIDFNPDDFASLNFINSGIVSTQLTIPDKAIEYSSIHNIQALISDFIINNNEYGIEENASFISFAGEDSFFSISRYGNLNKDTQSWGLLGDELILGIHRKTITKKTKQAAPEFGSEHKIIGQVRLDYNPTTKDWLLKITPEKK